MMRVEAKVYWFLTTFGLVVTLVYGLFAKTPEGDFEPTGTVALAMMTLLAALVAFYLTFGAGRKAPRPEDRKDGEIAEGAGDLGFFPPYSWWPLWSALAASAAVMGIIFGWWLFIIAFVVGMLTVCGFVLEYYRNDHAH